MPRTHTRTWILAGAMLAVLAVGAACGGAADDAGMDAPPPVDEFSREGSGGGASVQSADSLTNMYDAAEQIQAAPAGAVAPGDAAAVDGSTTSAPGTLPALLDRKIILTATLLVETGEVSRRFEDAGNIAAAQGGFVASSSFGTEDVFDEAGQPAQRQVASLTMRIPSANYQRAVGELRKLGEVKDVDTGSSDVTEEYVDLESRLRGLRAVEQQYMDFLGRATTIDEILTVQDRLNGVRVEMEQVQGRINLIGNQTDLATITVHLQPPVVAKEPVVEDEGKTSPVEALIEGWEASLAVLTGVAVVFLALIAFSWWLIPVAVAGVWAIRRFARPSAGRGRAAGPPEPTAPAA